MKIAMTGSDWYPQNAGGLEKYQYGLARTLTAGGDQVDFFCTGEPSAWDARARTIGIANPSAGTLPRLAQISASYRRNYREPYDVADLHFAFYALPLLPLISKRTARVAHFQGPWGQESRAEGGSVIASAIKERLERIVFGQIDRFVVLSEAFATILSETYGIARAKIDVISMGIDCDFFSPPSDRARVRAELGWPTDVPVIFTARRIVRRVGIAELIEATKILRARGVRLAIKIAGKGPQLEEYRAAVEAAGLIHEIEFLGFISEAALVRAYGAADVTLLPTQSLEGFGTIVAESLSCGTPAIGTPVGGLVETLAAIHPSLLAHDATAEGIADLLADFCGDQLVLPNARESRRYAETHYAWPAIAEQNRETYRRAIAERRSLRSET